MRRLLDIIVNCNIYNMLTDSSAKRTDSLVINVRYRQSRNDHI